MKKTNRCMQMAALAVSVSMFSGASADEAEDLSAEFQADLDRIAAAQGVAESGVTTTHANGMTSTVAGLSHMKMLMVRKNDDGSLSYEHVATAEEAEEFASADSDSAADEE